MASVEFLKAKRRWRVRWREAGKQRTSELFTSARAAEEAKRTVNARMAAIKGTTRVGRIPWPEVWERWLASKQASRYVAEARACMVRHTATWRTTESATPDAVSRLPIGASLIVRACLRWADLHLGQPIDRRALAQRGTRKRPKRAQLSLLSDDEVAALLASCADASPGAGALAHMIATYGHRAESLVGATGSSVDLDARRIRLVVKSGDPITHPLLPRTVEILRPLVRGPDDPLFLSHLGRPWASGQAFANWYIGMIDRTGYYRLKAWAITGMLARGVDAKTICSITGHRTPSILLDRYARTNDSRQAEALAAIEAGAVPTLLLPQKSENL